MCIRGCVFVYVSIWWVCRGASVNMGVRVCVYGWVCLCIYGWVGCVCGGVWVGVYVYGVCICGC